MKFFTEDRLLLRELFEHGSISNFYSMHEKYLLSPGQISNSIRKLIERGYASYDDKMLCLSPQGRELIIRDRKKIFFVSRKEYWKTPGNDKKNDKSDIANTDLYKIKMGKLNSKFFKLR